MAKKQYITNPRDIRKFKNKKIVTNTRFNNVIGKKPPPSPRQPCPPGFWPCGFYWSEQPGVGSRTQQCCPYHDAHTGRER